MCSTSQAVLCKPLISKTLSTNSSTRATATSQSSSSQWTTLVRCTSWSEWCVSRTTQAPAQAPRASHNREAVTLMLRSKCRILRNNSKYQTVLLKRLTTLERTTKCTSPLARTTWLFCRTKTAVTLWVGPDPVVRLGAKIRRSQAGRWCLFDKV